MKDKNIAGILALFLGGFGVHQFYLNKPGLGIAHFIPVMASRSFFVIMMSYMFAWATAISLFTMDQRTFDKKYNKGESSERNRRRETDFDRRRRDDDRRERWEERQRRREEYEYRRREPRGTSDRRTQRPKPKPTPKKRAKANPYKQSGITKFKEYDYSGAIEDFVKSLEIAPEDIATHFNIACAYSLNENADKAFEHLDKAVRLGFKEFKKIKEHDALAYLRIQDEFEDFEANGFMLKTKASENELPKEDLLSTTPDLLDQLKKLGELKEKGLLTEQEFAAQKEKLLKR